MRVSLTLAIRRSARYCSFVDNVSDIVNESIRPDLIVGWNKARRDARVTDAFICGNVTCRVPQERNVSTSGYVSRPMTIALDYTTQRKTILAVSFLGCSAPAWFRWYTHVRGEERDTRVSEKALILQNPVVRVSISLYIRHFYTYCITSNVVYRTTADLKCNIHFTQCAAGGYLASIKYSVLFWYIFRLHFVVTHYNILIFYLIF